MYIPLFNNIHKHKILLRNIRERERERGGGEDRQKETDRREREREREGGREYTLPFYLHSAELVHQMNCILFLFF